MQIKVKAPAKINLTLDIVGKRPDGYHLVKMIMQTVDLYDYITVSKNSENKIRIICDNDNVPTGADNIAYKAVELFFNTINEDICGIDVHIEKNIPIAAGLAGGSTDASATLVAMNRLYGNILSISELFDISKSLGADVPFCLIGGTMLAEDIGTVLSALPDIPSCFIVLAKPPITISTKEAYEKSDNLNYSNKDLSDIALKAIKEGNLRLLAEEGLYNRFEEVLQVEEVNNIKKLFAESGALGQCMSGSGATVFALFDDLVSAQNCLNTVKKQYKEAFLCKPTYAGSFLSTDKVE